jgi:hypothetical protein
MIVHRQPSPIGQIQFALLAVLGLWALAAMPPAVRAQATRPSPAPAAAKEEPRYPRSTPIPEDMIRRRPRQVIALPSEPGEYGEDPLQLSSGVLGKLPPDVHRLPEGYVVSSQQMAVEQQPNWIVCYLPDERLLKLPIQEAGAWVGDLDKSSVPAGLVKAGQDKGIALAADSKVHIEQRGSRWRVTDPRRALVVEKDADSIVVRSALPLRILPNKRLTMLESVMAAAENQPNFAFTGRVTEFQGNNYLLVEHLAEVIEAAEQTAPAPSAAPSEGDENSAAPQGEAPATAPAGEPRPEDIIKQLLERKPRRALVLPQSMPAPAVRPIAPGQDPESARDQQLMPEETMIIDQPGRVVPVDEWWTFAFEDKGRQASRRPLRIIPNRMLENAIALTGDESMGVILLVSGEVTEYRGTNYLLLRKVLVQRDWGNLR